MKASSQRTIRKRARLRDRGLGRKGGGWNIPQASTWSGIGEGKLRELAKRRLAGDLSIFPCHAIGRRIVISREGFRNWFNGRPAAAA
jgi:hypothetical protein